MVLLVCLFLGMGFRNESHLAQADLKLLLELRMTWNS